MLALLILSIRHVHPSRWFLRSLAVVMLPLRCPTSVKFDWERTLPLGSMPDWFVSVSCFSVLCLVTPHCGSNQETVHILPFSVFYSPCNYSVLGCYIVVAWVACFLLFFFYLCQAQCCFVMSTALELADCRRSSSASCPRVGTIFLCLFVLVTREDDL